MSPADLKLRIIQVVCESIKVHNICSTSIICVVPYKSNEVTVALCPTITVQYHSSGTFLTAHPITFLVFNLPSCLHRFDVSICRYTVVIDYEPVLAYHTVLLLRPLSPSLMDMLPSAGDARALESTTYDRLCACVTRGSAFVALTVHADP
jgi:hypothetical protein